MNTALNIDTFVIRLVAARLVADGHYWSNSEASAFVRFAINELANAGYDVEFIALSEETLYNEVVKLIK